MKDGVHLITCSRPGCNKDVGAQRFENDRIVEQEFVDGYIVRDNTYYCSEECYKRKDEFVTPEEIADE